MNRVFVNKDDPIYKYALNYMETSWGVKGRFPGSQPISIERKHFSLLQKNEYLVCEKTDGVRYMMLILQCGSQRLCLFINRALEMFVCHLNFRQAVFKGTILEGELYKDEFMVYDCLMSCGEVVGNKNLKERLEECEKVVKKALVLNQDSIKICVKKFHLYSDFENFAFKYLPKVKQEVDGLIFTPVNEPIRVGTHETMFKWKPKVKNTVDFLVKKGPTFETPGCKPGISVWRLYIQEKGKLIFESSIPEDKTSNFKWLKNGDIVECMYVTWEDGPYWWRPLKKRDDKTHPNNRRTFYNTLTNIKEDIQMKEFLDYKPKQNDDPV